MSPFDFLAGLTPAQLDAIEASARATLAEIERYRASMPARRPRARPHVEVAMPADVRPEEVERSRAALRARGVG